jgi:hypothetical protein
MYLVEIIQSERFKKDLGECHAIYWDFGDVFQLSFKDILVKKIILEEATVRKNRREREGWGVIQDEPLVS